MIWEEEGHHIFINHEMKYKYTFASCWEPRVIVVVEMDPWTPCHMSTIPAPVVDSPSKKKTFDHKHKFNHTLKNDLGRRRTSHIY